VRWSDLRGVDDVIRALEAKVALPFENDALTAGLRLKPKRGVLIAGPPGTGKTTIGRALAHRLKSKFFLIDGTVVAGSSDFFDDVKAIFERARRNAPSIVFIDDTDVIFDDNANPGFYRYLLTVLDGLESASSERVCVMMTAMNPGSLPAVFASAWGDLAINDYLCATLVTSAHDVSPTKFHNSVHNAPAGYWAIATGCMANTSAISAGQATFGAGLLEAALLAVSENVPVLFVVYDIAAVGALSGVIATRGPFGCALVLAPRRERAGAALRIDLADGPAPALAPDPWLLHPSHRDNPAAHGLPLLTALARARAQAVGLPAGPRQHLHLEIATWQN